MLDSSNIETNFDEEKIILPYSSNKTTFFNFLQRKPYNLKLQTNSPRMTNNNKNNNHNNNNKD